eukprot:Seg1385.7 transcript_id=Seg1385.7/GoldUCD/mRNA.D3Y31 product="putative calcium-binding protein" protein_id=Seg1385.7/GoldUCD/D3Y31
MTEQPEIKCSRWENHRTFKMGTFNLLAPCYKTIETSDWKTWWGGRKESSHPDLFLQRYEEIFKILDKLPSFDFMCLQEFWFDNNISELFEKRIGDRYAIYKHRRPTRHDGVALLINRQYKVEDVEYIKYNDIGMRVALLAHITDTKTDQEAIIVTTHLTYLANYLDQFTRMTQAKKLAQAIEDYLARLDRKDVPLFLAGDFNGTPAGPIYKFFADLGFNSSYKNCHGNEPIVTHCDHNCSVLAVDYIFYRMPDELECMVNDAYLIPKDRTDKEWPDDFVASDHRLVFAEVSVSQKRT